MMQTLNDNTNNKHTVDLGSHIARTKAEDSTETGRTVSVLPSLYNRVMEAS